MDVSRRGGDFCFARAGDPRGLGARGRQGLPRPIIDDIKEELRWRPYELVAVAGGWRHQTRKGFAEAIRAATGLADPVKELSRAEAGVLMAIAYFQPVTRGEISEMFGHEISRDLIGSLRGAGLIAAGPRGPQPGAPYAYVTTPGFLSEFGFESLRDLPDLEKLEDAGLLDVLGNARQNDVREPDFDDSAAHISDFMPSARTSIDDDDLEEDAA
jgi:chromosome segregation and condensation protein ScpB